MPSWIAWKSWVSCGNATTMVAGMLWLSKPLICWTSSSKLLRRKTETTYLTRPMSIPMHDEERWTILEVTIASVLLSPQPMRLWNKEQRNGREKKARYRATAFFMCHITFHNLFPSENSCRILSQTTKQPSKVTWPQTIATSNVFISLNFEYHKWRDDNKPYRLKLCCFCSPTSFPVQIVHCSNTELIRLWRFFIILCTFHSNVMRFWSHSSPCDDPYRCCPHNILFRFILGQETPPVVSKLNV